MAPEKGMLMTRKILDDAQIFKERLLVVQEKMHERALSTMNEELDDIREAMNLEVPDDIDTSDLIDVRIEDKKIRIAPELITRAIPLTKKSTETTRAGRVNVEQIIKGEDDRIFVIVGPCSIHDPEAAIEYAEKVKQWRELYGDDLEIIMRMYPEKPRTEIKEDPLESWKGLAYDPNRDGSNDINLGTIATRLLACQITNSEVPIAVERLDPTTPQYIDGLVVYDAIGARNTTSQNARHYGSGTSSVLGFKNTTEGSIDAAVEAAASANVKSTFSGTSSEGFPMEVWTKGNDTAHVILRGDQNGPNYTEDKVSATKDKLRAKNLPEAIIIDVSHGNSNKDASKQIEVIEDVSRQISLGEAAIKGVMIESNLVAGKQNIKKIKAEGRELRYGQSITDECVGLEETQQMLVLLAGAVRARRKRSNNIQNINSSGSNRRTARHGFVRHPGDYM